MDALERLSSVGADLLARVDAALAAGGAPADDPIWPLLRQVGALPADVLDFGLRLDHIALRSAATELRAVADRFARQPARLAADIGRSAWEGTGAEAFAAVWESLSEHIGEGTDPATVTGRLLATASYVDDLAGWAADLRHELAEAIARVATSAEAVTLRGSDDAATRVAAARIGARVLQPAADAMAAAEALQSRWAADLAELPYTPPAAPSGAAPTTGITRVSL
jgi:hypothetical protein